MKSVMDWAISSQASWEQDEGSTTRSWSPERTVKTHECRSFVGILRQRLNNHMYLQMVIPMINKKSNSESDNTKFYYVYKITNKLNNKIYIGCHQTKKLDDGYMGSGKYINRAYEKYGVENFSKEILNFYPDSESIFNAEAMIVSKEFIQEDSNYNLATGGRGGYKGEDCYKSSSRSHKIRQMSVNKVLAKDNNGNIIKVKNTDLRLQTKELVGATKGKAVVKDADGNNFVVDVDDPRIESGELVGITKGFAVMKDADGNRHQVPLNDPRIKTGELVGITKGIKQSEESNRKRSESLKGIKRVPTFASCLFCKKSTSLTNIIRWHKNCC